MTGTAAEAAIVCLLAAWLAVTVFGALPRAEGAVDRCVPAWFRPLIPSWSFFAPNPPSNDRVLVYRDIRGDHTLGPFREVWPPGRTGPALLDGRADKAATDAISELLVLVAKRHQASDEPSAVLRSGDAARVMVSTPYLLLLNRVTTAPHDPLAEAVQFAVTTTNHLQEEPEIVFVSATHRLEVRRWEAAC